VPLLPEIKSPDDLRPLTPTQLRALAAEIREFLVSNVSKTGGHLGSNLGVVELTLALHRVFDSPEDVIVFDTGHQTYVHKMLTGRQGAFGTLRQHGGLSGYPSRAESEHDWLENSHASVSLSWAYGMAQSFKIRGEGRHVVAVIGDGALTGGLAWEALNNLATFDDLRLVVVVNDNGRSYTPTVGGLATQLDMLGKQLSAIRTDRRYERLMKAVKRTLRRTPLVGEPMYGLLHGFKAGVRDVLVPRSLFPDLGLKYVGPINGHDEQAVELALRQAKNFGGPVLVHCLTGKGRGFRAAEEDKLEHFHAVGKFDETSGEPLEPNGARAFADAFGEALAGLGERDGRLVALTAAMLNPVGLRPFAERFPGRVFDAGIAEQHMVATAAGLAAAGMHPVVAVYSTFLNRAFDQVLLDVGMHRLGVTFVLDRAGVTGPDGASHHGMWDVSTLGLVPGLRLANVRDEPVLRTALERATSVADAPTVIRYPKGAIPAPFPVAARRGDVDLLRADPDARVLLVAYGLPSVALEAAELLAESGVPVTVADPVWALPVPPDLVALAREHEYVATLEDNLVQGGLGHRLAQAVGATDVTAVPRCHHFGIPLEYLPHGTRAEILAEIGLTAPELAATMAADLGTTGD
jgi:1-deoxy-D-xylulose-5-phosphate synthase